MLVLFLIHSILPLTNCQLTKIVSSDAQIFQFENNQNLTFRGQELRNHVLQEFSTKYQVTQCALECHKTAKCKSFNFDENAKICQLNDATHEEFEDDLHNSTDKDYYLRDGITIDQEAIGPCGESPCQNDGSCLDVQAPRTRERGYICFCKKGWYGKNCEYEENRIDWSEWETWGSCSRTCGNGYQTRARACMDTVKNEVKSPTECYGKDIDYKGCVYTNCPRWGEWGAWSTCSTYTTCGRGHKERSRICTNGGKPGIDRYCLGPTNETAVCEGIKCDNAVRLADQGLYGEGRVEMFHSIDKKWLQVCADNFTATAGDVICRQKGFLGVHNVTQDTRNGSNNDLDKVKVNCTGNEWLLQQCHREEVDDCDVKAAVQCRVRGIWSLWTSWGECSVTCENGTRTRTRECNHPPPNFNGTQCPGNDTEYKPCTLKMCPIDGVWTSWASWSPCSVSCANGTQFRTRNCTGPFYGGNECEGPAEEVIECFPKICPVDGIWEPWADWSECTLPCGYGTRNRSRVCRGPFYGGLDCDGDLTQTEGCNSFSCPVDGMWMSWSEWEGCSVSCGGGIQNRTRECISPKHGGQSCEGASSESQSCQTHPCPVDGEWKPWTDWDACNVTCGGGGKMRYRDCEGPYFGGKECKGPTDEWKECGTDPCPVDGIWNAWTNWTECSHTCGTGYQTRNRTCDGPYHNGKDCDGEEDHIQDCNTHPCPVDGYWGDWSNWTACNSSCGGGNTWRTRECVEPLHGGANCTGADLESKPCNTHNCPVDGLWAEWSEWSNCSLPCGNGTQTRNRTCIGPFFDGKECDGEGEDERMCNTHFCPINGVWEEWSNWTDCSTSCGRGTQSRSRVCDGPYHDGDQCEGPLTEARACHTKNCPVDGVWEAWSPWGGCDVTCGGGIQWRDRGCEGPFYGGANCSGPHNESQDCNTLNCPVDGVWMPWTDWGDCTVTCGGGMQGRSRTCEGPFYNGGNCVGDYSETQDCQTHECPVDGKFTDWSAWGSCDVTCGGGTQSRNRSCDGPYHGGQDCIGDLEEHQDCNTDACPVKSEWGQWEAWHQCSEACGGGMQLRYRQCPTDACPGINFDFQSCNAQPCKKKRRRRSYTIVVDGIWTEWANWGECSVSCGGGIQTRNRTCDGPYHGGADCVGDYSEEMECGTDPCPIPGEWMEWTLWSRCTTTCGGGLRYRSHECNMTSYGDLTAPCLGSENDTEECHTYSCNISATSCTQLGEWGLVDSTYADLKPLNQNQTKQRVYCDMDSENGIGVTVIGHDKERTTNVTGFEGAGEYRAVIQYNISLDSVIAIIDSSANCEQYLRWDCKGAVIHNPHTGEWTTFWTNRTSADGQSRNRYTRPADYFAGATPGSHKCACGMTNSCAFANVTCNCDANQDIWRFDEGNITIKDDLPILAFRAGDTGIPDDDVEESGKHTIGPVRCSG